MLLSRDSDICLTVLIIVDNCYKRNHVISTEKENRTFLL